MTMLGALKALRTARTSGGGAIVSDFNETGKKADRVPFVDSVGQAQHATPLRLSSGKRLSKLK